MATLRQPGLKGSPRSRPGDNLDSGAPIDGREIAERAREGRSRKAADNALDRTPPDRRLNPLSTLDAAQLNAAKCETCNGTGFVCENHHDRPWRGLSEDRFDACSCGAGAPCPICQ